ncbi:MAG TPA: GAF domain-containing protein, partial [Baekduia sp.]|nr:GAF domain-containing protein [Baekduia sp.]
MPDDEPSSGSFIERLEAALHPVVRDALEDVATGCVVHLRPAHDAAALVPIAFAYRGHPASEFAGDPAPPIPLDAPVGRLIAHGEPLRLETRDLLQGKPDAGPRARAHVEQVVRRLGHQSLHLFPLSERGAVLGVLSLAGPADRRFLSARERRAAEQLADRITTTIRLLQAEEQVEALRRSERARGETLEEVNELFRLAFEHARSALAVLREDGRVLQVNEPLARLLGRAAGDIAGESVVALTHPGAADAVTRLWGEALTARANVEISATVDALHADGHPVPVDVRIRVLDGPGSRRLFFVVLHDRSAGDRRARHRQARGQVLDAVLRGAPEQEVLAALVELLEDQAPGVAASVLLLDDTGLRLRHAAVGSLPDAYIRAVDDLRVGPEAGSCGTAAFLGRQVIAADLETDPRWDGLRQHALAHGLRASWSTPVRGGDRELLGTFALYPREPRGPTPAGRPLSA